MTDADDLLVIADELAAFEANFVRAPNSQTLLPREDERKFNSLVTEAKAIIKSSLGPANDFVFEIDNATRLNGMIGGVTPGCLGEVEALVRGAARHLSRTAGRRVPPLAFNTPTLLYVSPLRVAEIEALRSPNWDFAKLVQLCKELNGVASKDCHYATAMLVRAITDHVPPVFRMTSFAQVASSYGGSHSFKKSMQHLQGSLRNIADGMLHEQIRPRETLPSSQQVDFRQDLDRLLGEIVRIASAN